MAGERSGLAEVRAATGSDPYRWLEDVEVDAVRAREFGDVTASGEVTAQAPPLFGVCLVRPAFVAGLTEGIPVSVDPRTPVLHGEHLYRSTRPLELGEALSLESALLGTLTKPSGALVVIGARLVDALGTVEEHELTAFLPGADLGPATGRAGTPASELAPDRGEGPESLLTVLTQPDLSRRYGLVADDTTAFHMDDEQARRYGFPGVILHGLCTLTLATNALLREVDTGSRVSRLAARFAAPGFPGEDLVVRHHRGDAGELGFTVSRPDGTPLVKHGSMSVVGSGS